MCTVTFWPRKQGYALGMNRDERLARVAGLPPVRERVGERLVVSPREPGGGTWIAANDLGVTVALINWYSVTARASDGAVSRGEVVNAVSASTSSEAVESGVERLPLDRINPFRLIGIFPREQCVVEWRWDLRRLVRKRHHWEAQQWASSGFDEPMAQMVRGETFRRALSQRSAGSTDWLRRLHRSHAPGCGPFSTCMHRADAATVSYTEVVFSQNGLEMRYEPVSLCVNKMPKPGLSV